MGKTPGDDNVKASFSVPPGAWGKIFTGFIGAAIAAIATLSGGAYFTRETDVDELKRSLITMQAGQAEAKATLSTMQAAINDLKVTIEGLRVKAERCEDQRRERR